jgi:heavy metal sensor kinase
MKSASISLRLTAWFGGIFLLGWLAFGAAMWLNLKSTLTGERRSTLARRLDRLEDLLNQTRNESAADRYQDYRDFAHATGNGLEEVFHPDGLRALQSPSSAAQFFAWPIPSSGARERFLQVDSDGQPYWVLLRPVTLNGESLILASAAPATGNILVLDRFLVGLLASMPVLLLISSACGYWVSRRALLPVDRITATARYIGIRNLAKRLPALRSGDELERLTETFNAMLARLESAVGQIKQFTADASHELRGPLSFTRTVAEVALRNPALDPESRRAFEEIVEESAKAAVLLDDMLTLARADSGAGDAVLEPLNLADVIEQACELARPIATERNLAISVSVAPSVPVEVLGDYSSLRRLLWILLDNALKYTRAPGRIEVDLRSTTREAKVMVRDTGIGIPQSDLPHIFDRFYRADPSRSLVEGSGLGLAIAKWIADLHHGDLTVESELNKGTAAHLVLPLCGSAATLQ